MSVEEVNSSTVTTDLVILIRDRLRDNIDDPLLTRGANEKFVLTSYPKETIKYPIITVVDTGSNQIGKLGMGSQGTVLRLGIEIRVWARNIKERDTLFDMVHNYLRTNQLEGDDITEANLHDFNMNSVVNVSEDDVKSKVGEFTWLYLCV